MVKYTEMANTIAALTDLPAFFSNNGNIEVVNTRFLSQVTRKHVFGFLFRKPVGLFGKNKPSKPPKLLRYVNHFGLSFLNIIVSTAPMQTILFGPFFLEDKDTDDLTEKLLSITHDTFTEETARELINSFPVKDAAFIQAWGQIVYRFLDMPKTSYVKINTIKENPEAKEAAFSISENRLNEAEITAHYNFEQEMRQLIIQGNREKLRQLLIPKKNSTTDLARNNSVLENRMNKVNSIRTEKNLLITLNAIFRLSAAEAGLTPLYIHSISDSISDEIEGCTEREQLLTVISRMIDLYCNSINNISLQNHSVNIVKVQRYIADNMNQKITLDDLCLLTGLDEAYLCRLFKRECHMTITEFIQQQRINEAKNLLKSSKMSIVEIANLLGFSSQSYFCSVFKKQVGVSPSSYRMNHGKFYNPK